ncbi:hypothetical protein [Streptomyces acidiscabies]|uniref:HPr kinase/phosphorylase n=1 Tax=Streptomyces acidiscabies TaxID=42234 RepID=A0AAP6BJX8_9ACTN|nr:hypothetical protein [Streptomyces acidiscabies]MBP5936760.1 hypothetical protein [Streptomyces sp. LBUM 1476]MBZ3915233.1 hypothetical protein [Streptomyces acidiscabies]MDX2966076.1 hypothetical protein [Streptomyces acidiscabies]MDX3021295.1 hypothetical protein [Streptomyces acidiscabies]MDX3793452.1 hypothetical protein [Streptomyces acidiscabies]
MTLYRITTGHVHGILELTDQVRIPGAPALPGGWTLEPYDATDTKADVEISLGTPDVTAGPHTVHIRLTRAAATSDTFAHVTYTALERLRQRQRKITVHATALVAPDGRALLLLGAKSAGKTSTALALAERGWIHAGDDLVVLGASGDGTVEVWPGKPTAAVRDPQQPLAPKAQLSLFPFTAGPSPLAWVVRVAVHPVLRTRSLTPAVPLTLNERLRLHELLARYISGLPTPLGVTGMPYGTVWPLDSPALARQRHELIHLLAACRYDYLHAPDAQTAADLLDKEAG